MTAETKDTQAAAVSQAKVRFAAFLVHGRLFGKSPDLPEWLVKIGDLAVWPSGRTWPCRSFHHSEPGGCKEECGGTGRHAAREACPGCEGTGSEPCATCDVDNDGLSFDGFDCHGAIEECNGQQHEACDGTGQVPETSRPLALLRAAVAAGRAYLRSGKHPNEKPHLPGVSLSRSWVLASRCLGAALRYAESSTDENWSKWADATQPLLDGSGQYEWVIQPVSAHADAEIQAIISAASFAREDVLSAIALELTAWALSEEAL